jgi:hypothetical protein
MKRFYRRRSLLAAVIAAWLALSAALSVSVSGKSTGGFAGIEYLTNDSQTSRQELQKLLGLKIGASYESAERAIERLREKLEQRRLRANLDIIEGDQDEFYVSVDILRVGYSSDAPTRRLEFPRRVFLSNNKPLELLAQLDARRIKLQDEGRPTEVVYRDGVKHYSDVSCDRIVDQLMIVAPVVRTELLQMIASDPDAKRRMAAIELLNWAGQPMRDSLEALPAINDVDVDVRVVAAKYVVARIDRLPDGFPWNKLIEAYSLQLGRPSHRDRVTGLYCLAILSKEKPQLLYNVKVFSEERLKQLVEHSSIPSIRSRSQELLGYVEKVKAPPQEMSPGEFNGF